MLMTSYTYNFLSELESNQNDDYEYYIDKYNIMLLDKNFFKSYCAEHELDANDIESIKEALDNDVEAFVADVAELNLEIDGLTDYMSISDVLDYVEVYSVNEQPIFKYELTAFEYRFLQNVKIRQDKIRLNDADVKYYIAEDLYGIVKLFNVKPTIDIKTGTEWVSDENNIGMICDLSSLYSSGILDFDTLDFECISVDELLMNSNIIDEY